MIIELLLDAIYGIMSTLMVLEIPSLPDEVHAFITDAFTYITSGAGILANYTPLGYLMMLFGVLLAIDAGILVYHFIMWIIKKIPMLGIE